ncbi:MAG TPA: radical SAM protein [Nitrososphaerales archaeon]|nr:radical SAM protein [Nitrososphaerales archaeon]
MESLIHDDRKIRSLTARASQLKDPDKQRQAAFKAWHTIRQKQRERAAQGSKSMLDFMGELRLLPPGVSGGTYKLAAPLVKQSKLTNFSKGGVGKELSDGWVVNFSIGCTFGCRFCYVDAIHKKFSFLRAGSIVYNDWGDYFAVPENLSELIEKTPWEKWKGQEIMLSSTHDPYLPHLNGWARKILEASLPHGVKFCIQTRSPLVERDFDIIEQYRKQVRLQVSIATMNEVLSRLVEPRVVTPKRRMQVLKRAKELGLRTGIIVAPVFPPTEQRPDVKKDLEMIADCLSDFKPDYIYGESLHVRGINIAYIEKAVGEKLVLDGFDEKAEAMFHDSLKRKGLKGRWWREY